MSIEANLNVDVLNDFISGTLPVPNGIEVVKIINRATNDLRPGVINIFIADDHDPANIARTVRNHQKAFTNDNHVTDSTNQAFDQ